MRHSLLFFVIALSGCFSMPPKAPDGVDDLTRFLFREWAHEDPSVLQDGMEKLEKILVEEVDFSKKLKHRRFELESFTEEDVAGIPWPDTEDPSSTIGMAVAFESKWPVVDHARLQVEADLLLKAEKSAKNYKRRFIHPTDASCFIKEECPAFHTENDITRSNSAMEIDIMLHKDFKWVHMPDGRVAIVSRSWNPRVFVSEKSDKDQIVQSYTLDIWLERPDGKTWRYQALYQESKVGGLIGLFSDDEAAVVSTVTSATDDMFKDTDDVIGEHYHGK